ncbi:MAG: 2-keto-3-deoxy-L-rhamnonate aldolase [Sphingobium sp.]|nr:MAG: 2-keto-3-deoxy-L-rhamnonate aldolase [Sphingobium sp.]
MNKLHNAFKHALAEGRQQIGLWLGLGDVNVAELCAHAGFDWLAIDGEHGPNDLRSILSQLRAIQGSKASAVVRLPSDDRVMIKQHLDIGAQSLLIPMIESAEQAREVVRSCRYAPEGARGIGAALARASQYGQIGDYLYSAGDEICILLQVETKAGIDALDEILKVDGVDGVFVGPSDLAADMGLRGKASSAEVQAVVVSALEKIGKSQKASGILTSDIELARQYQGMGVSFLAVGSDVGVLVSGLRQLRNSFRKP